MLHCFRPTTLALALLLGAGAAQAADALARRRATGQR